MFTLSEAYEALNGHDEFVAKVYDGKVSFDYVVILPNSFDATENEIRLRAYLLWEKAGCPENVDFWNQAEQDIKKYAHIRRNFRGVTFDVTTGKMLSLPLNKFFNVNQIPETQYSLIKDCDAIIYEKLDGTMIHFFLHGDKLEAATCRSTFSPLAYEALAFAKSNNLIDLISQNIREGYTPIFEYVAPTNQVVIQYDKPRLVYLISRCRDTGKYFFDEEFPDKARRFKFLFSEVYENLDKTDFEGYVCHLPHMIVKAKTPWYMDRHRAVDALMRPAYKLYQIVFDGMMDDLIAIAAESYKPALTKIYEEAQRDLLSEKLRIESVFASLIDDLNQQQDVVKTHPLHDFVQNIKSMVAKGKKFEAIKLIRDKIGIGLNDALNFIEKGVWPHGVIQADEQDVEAQKRANKTSRFVQLVRQKIPNDFNVMMVLYNGGDPSNIIKDKLMSLYREKYSFKLYAKFDDNHENG